MAIYGDNSGSKLDIRGVLRQQQQEKMKEMAKMAYDPRNLNGSIITGQIPAVGKSYQVDAVNKPTSELDTIRTALAQAMELAHYVTSTVETAIGPSVREADAPAPGERMGVLPNLEVQAWRAQAVMREAMDDLRRLNERL